jgi:hypothetical protein
MGTDPLPGSGPRPGARAAPAAEAVALNEGGAMAAVGRGRNGLTLRGLTANVPGDAPDRGPDPGRERAQAPRMRTWRPSMLTRPSATRRTASG